MGNRIENQGVPLSLAASAAARIPFIQADEMVPMLIVSAPAMRANSPASSRHAP